VANSPPTKDCTAAMMGYCMTIDHDTRVSMSPHPPQDGRWAVFVPASYKNMTLSEAQLSGSRLALYHVHVNTAGLHASATMGLSDQWSLVACCSMFNSSNHGLC
jgi:hypothetical protein